MSAAEALERENEELRKRVAGLEALLGVAAPRRTASGKGGKGTGKKGRSPTPTGGSRNKSRGKKGKKKANRKKKSVARKARAVAALKQTRKRHKKRRRKRPAALFQSPPVAREKAELKEAGELKKAVFDALKPFTKIDQRANSESLQRMLQEERARGSPFDSFYLVNLGAVVDQFLYWKRCFPRVRPFYAVKSNPDGNICRVLKTLGCGYDCASQAELDLVKAMGVKSKDIIFANPCKSLKHIQCAKERAIKKMTFDNEYELVKIQTNNPKAALVLRILPDDRHSLMPFGKKFGANWETSKMLIAMCKEKRANLIGVSFHVGSGCFDAVGWVEALQLARRVFDYAAECGFQLKFLDIGGGFPGTDEGLRLEDIGARITPLLDELFPADVEVIAEPGRFFCTQAYTLAVVVNAKRKTLKSPAAAEAAANNNNSNNNSSSKVEDGGSESGSAPAGDDDPTDSLTNDEDDDDKDDDDNDNTSTVATSGTDTNNEDDDDDGDSSSPPSRADDDDSYGALKRSLSAPGSLLLLEEAAVRVSALAQEATVFDDLNSGQVEFFSPESDADMDAPVGHDKEFMYYLSDGVYGSFNNIMFDHAHPEPVVLALQRQHKNQREGKEVVYSSRLFGPTCDSIDVICEDVKLPELDIGDWLYFPNMGAYTIAAASSFNGFAPPNARYILQFDSAGAGEAGNVAQSAPASSVASPAPVTKK